MKRMLIDTNVYSEFKRGTDEVVSRLQTPEEVLICATVMGELLGGFRCGNHLEKNIRELEEFLDRPRVKFVETGYMTAEYYAEVYRTLRGKGQPIPTNDMWITASALEHGAALYSLDDHFDSIDTLLRPPL
ncbi:MAG: type II toxin-antitoxin system VapC family toxin [Planctomycetes bacterium]|nr:type II toxin-antitoxin system VapC family toxin [Planctomycetota bacterium]